MRLATEEIATDGKAKHLRRPKEDSNKRFSLLRMKEKAGVFKTGNARMAESVMNGRSNAWMAASTALLLVWPSPSLLQPPLQ